MIAVPLYVLILTHAGPTQSDPVSARRFVQAFYDWYTPIAETDHSVPASDFALKHKAAFFSPNLLLALREDSAAQSKAKGEIVGLDFDPFVSGQDPPGSYSVGTIIEKHPLFYASIYSSVHHKRSAKPIVIALVEKQKGTWQFTNFLYPGGPDLLSILKNLKRDRVLHPSSPRLLPVSYNR